MKAGAPFAPLYPLNSFRLNERLCIRFEVRRLGRVDRGDPGYHWTLPRRQSLAYRKNFPTQGEVSPRRR